MSAVAGAGERVVSAGRRWGSRVAALLLGVAVLMGADRLAHHLWYAQVYLDDGAPLSDKGKPLVNKNWLRFAPDPWLGRRYHPGLRLQLRMFNQATGQWAGYTLATSSLGLRGPEVARPKPAGVLRVVAMGGSSTMGQGVTLEQTYVHQLAAALRRALPGRRVEAVNAGVQGYASRHGYLQYLRVVRDLSPDLLVVAYDVNDSHRPYTRAEVAAFADPRPRVTYPAVGTMPSRCEELLSDLRRDHGDAGPGLAAALRRSGLYLTLAFVRGWVHVRLWPEEAPPPPPPVSEEERAPAPRRCADPPVFGGIARPWDPEVTEYEENLVALDLLAGRDGVPVIYLSVPLEGLGDIAAPYPYSAAMARVAGDREDRAHVDPSAAFCRHTIGEVMLDFCHPTAEGHAIIARALVEPALRVLRASGRLVR